MPRPRKCRRICMAPRCNRFAPEDASGDMVVEMTLDEFEAIRLMDWEGLRQEECAAQMDVARTTVQAIYSSARKKIASCLVNGRKLVIDGGEYRLCESDGCERRANCPRASCYKQAVSEEEKGE